MSEKHIIGNIVFNNPNPAPDAAAPFTGMNTQALMMSYGTMESIPALQHRITALERDKAELARELEAARAKPDWIRVEDALPVISNPDNPYERIWLDKAHWQKQPMWIWYHTGMDLTKTGATHWRYAEPTPQPPEGIK